ncbi:hypothetical protein DFP94_10290 [Fontibacillus phaseoli]|uniref:Uncharacterized protein n=1 Tax=Fontibacillus phaseoli TaxID=1416533 RepID=A0A369BIE4_9BACL|nr:hypothetical protein DFP94_10290 [Fontibacillus phaseoli]
MVCFKRDPSVGIAGQLTYHVAPIQRGRDGGARQREYYTYLDPGNMLELTWLFIYKNWLEVTDHA